MPESEGVRVIVEAIIKHNIKLHKIFEKYNLTTSFEGLKKLDKQQIYHLEKKEELLKALAKLEER